MDLASIAIYLIAGVAGGYLAGMFGVGGGIILVPILSFLFHAHGFADSVVMPLAVGTAMASICVTSLQSARAHGRHGNVDWQAARRLLPMVMVGSAIGAYIGASISHQALKLCVILFELCICALFARQAIFNIATSEQHAVSRPIPPTAKGLVAIVIGAVSSVVGIGGGTMFVPFLSFTGTPMRKAIGTASALGIPIAVVATAVYIVNGLQSDSLLPNAAWGYIYIPAFLGCLPGGLFAARHGAALAKRLNLRALKGAFAVILFIAALKMAL
jgi:uncharacterized membrane protein YfcA